VELVLKIDADFSLEVEVGVLLQEERLDLRGLHKDDHSHNKNLTYPMVLYP